MSKRTGPSVELQAATAIADTNLNYLSTTAQVYGNSVALFLEVSVGTASNLDVHAQLSHDGSNFFDIGRFWPVNGGDAAGVGKHYVPLSGLNIAPGDTVKIGVQCDDITASPELAVFLVGYDSGKGDACGTSGSASYPGTVPGAGYKSYTDSSFVVGETGRVLDFNTDLGRNATVGYIANRGAGDISIKLGVPSLGDAIILESGDVFSFDGLNVDSVELTWVANSAYDVFVK